MAENPNTTVIPLIFDNGFVQVTRGDVTVLVIDLGGGRELASADLSDSECAKLIAALSKPVEEEVDPPDETECEPE